MLKVRIIPSLLIKNSLLVKDKLFKKERVIGSIISSIKVYNNRKVDEIIILDTQATNLNQDPNYELIEQISSHCFIPLTVGGGINKIEHVSNLLKSGADKISINTSCINNHDLIHQIVNKYGSQILVASVDVKKTDNNSYTCYTNSGTLDTGESVIDIIKNLEKIGVGEILITSIDKDGMMTGYDLDLIKLVSKNVSIPIICQGGCGSYQDMLDAINSGANAICASSIFSFSEQTPFEAKEFLKRNGINVRF